MFQLPQMVEEGLKCGPVAYRPRERSRVVDPTGSSDLSECSAARQPSFCDLPGDHLAVRGDIVEDLVNVDLFGRTDDRLRLVNDRREARRRNEICGCLVKLNVRYPRTGQRGPQSCGRGQQRKQADTAQAEMSSEPHRAQVLTIDQGQLVPCCWRTSPLAWSDGRT